MREFPNPAFYETRLCRIITIGLLIIDFAMLVSAFL